MHRYLRCVLGGVIVASFVGCTNGVPQNPPALSPLEAMTGPVDAPSAEYVLNPGDTIAVKFFYNPELNELVTIRPDGKVSLQLIDDVTAGGMTPAEFDKTLTQMYSTKLRDPEITVIVKEFALQEIFVGGEVMNPGAIPWRKDKTVLRAIFEAGGFRDTAQAGSAIIVSKGPNNTVLARPVNLKTLMSTHKPGQQADILLQPFDIIFVPKTFIAKANQFIRQYIVGMLPVNLSAGFSYALVKDGYVIVR
jgi:protein involved in polysaccharide export with SLBB domain